MGFPTPHTPVIRLLAVISRYEAALEWSIGRTAAAWGPIALRSESFAFEETDYYQSTMGAGLKKMFLAFEQPADPGGLGSWKHQTDAWEREYAAQAGHAEPRPLNLDPGYITLAKLVLASTKDHAHRIYLGDGMFAEVTLYFKGGAWLAREWTFPDYRRSDYQQFFLRVRDLLRKGKAGLP
ncbi:MAG TPA: DUF4416 family protein [Pirellulales bacterium]|jgi:hypothetical protein|nr:DUF4416 family protein [Pirellulales bacterium]